MKMNLNLFVLLLSIAYCQCFSLLRSLRTPTARQSKIFMALTEISKEKLRVTGGEGLLDVSRMDRAFKGSGIKIPEGKKLKVKDIPLAA